jgi:hypothetical protein
LEVALKDFELVVREDPGWAQPHLDLANLYYRLNRPEDGKRERAVFDRLTAEQPKPGTASRAPSALPSR